MDNSDSAGKEGRPRVDHPEVFPFDRAGWNWRVFNPPLENPENEFRQEASHDLHIAPNWAAAGNQAPIGTPGYQSAANYYAPSPSIGPGYHTAGSYNSHPCTGPALPASSEGPSHLNNLPAAVVGGVGNYEQSMNPSGGMNEEVDSHGKFKTEEVPHDNREKYKTELCYHWESHGYCPYGDHCTFAHGEQELRPVTRHAHYKTKHCYNVLAGGSCSFAGPALPAYSEGPSHLYNLPAAVAGGVGNYEQSMNPSGGMNEEVDSHGKFKTEEVPHDNREKYKTELCYHWESHGYCPYGDHCTFAHGEQELRPVTRHAHYKTKHCYNVLAGGSCSFAGPALPAYSEGPSHLYNLPAAVAGGVGNYEQNMNPSGGMNEEVDSHGKFKTEEVPHDNQEKYKTELCHHWESHGYCPYGDHCSFAHGEQELRPVTRHAHYKTKL